MSAVTAGDIRSALDPRAIEDEISRIRERESNPYSAGSKTNIFTLVVFRSVDPQAPGSSDHVDPALQFLLGKRPGRIITLERARAAQTQVSVSGRCFPDRRNRGVCFEEVRIASGDDGVGADPGSWAPLVIRELPVFAWMPDTLQDESALWKPALKESAGLIDKLLVDSSRSPGRDSEVAATLQALQDASAGAYLVSDFSWRRSRVLREQAARAFDPPEARPLLAAIRSVQLYGGSKMEAWLFFQWLQSRLGRPVGSDHAWEGPLSEGFKVTFKLDGAAPVEIGCTKGGCLSHGEEKGAYRFPTEGEILLDELDTLARDPVFGDVLSRGHRPYGSPG